MADSHFSAQFPTTICMIGYEDMDVQLSFTLHVILYSPMFEFEQQMAHPNTRYQYLSNEIVIILLLA